MVHAAKRLRFKMLGWLMVPLFLLVFLSAHLIKTVETFALTLHDKSKQVQLTEGDIPTTTPVIPPLDYKNTGLVTLWFDDAWESQYSIGLPALDKYGFKGALAVPTKAVDTFNYMTWLQVKRTQHKGWEITAHSQVHNCNMQFAGQQLVNSEVLNSQTDLRTRGLRSDIYVTPCGVSNALVDKTARQSYPLGLRTSDTGYNSIPVPYSYNLYIQAVTDKTTKRDVQGWLAQAKLQRKWLIIVFHRLDNPHEEYDTDSKHFQDIIDAVHESGLPVVLPSQVLSLKGTKKLVPPPDDYDPNDKNIPLDESFEVDIPDAPDTSSDDSTSDDDITPTITPVISPTPVVTVTPDPNTTPIITPTPVTPSTTPEDEEE